MAGHGLLDVFAQVVRQMPAVGDLDRLRGVDAGALRIAVGPVPADDLRAGMGPSARPLKWRLRVRQQVDLLPRGDYRPARSLTRALSEGRNRRPRSPPARHRSRDLGGRRSAAAAWPGASRCLAGRPAGHRPGPAVPARSEPLSWPAAGSAAGSGRPTRPPARRKSPPGKPGYRRRSAVWPAGSTPAGRAVFDLAHITAVDPGRPRAAGRAGRPRGGRPRRNPRPRLGAVDLPRNASACSARGTPSAPDRAPAPVWTDRRSSRRYGNPPGGDSDIARRTAADLAVVPPERYVARSHAYTWCISAPGHLRTRPPPTSRLRTSRMCSGEFVKVH